MFSSRDVFNRYKIYQDDYYEYMYNMYVLHLVDLYLLYYTASGGYILVFFLYLPTFY